MRKLIFVALLGAAGCMVRAGAGPGPVMEGSPPPPPPAGQPGAQLTGMVMDARTHQPIDRAAVDITPASMPGKKFTVQTGKDGRYTTAVVPAGQFGVRARRGGYQTVEHQVDVGNVEARMDFELVPNH